MNCVLEFAISDEKTIVYLLDVMQLSPEFTVVAEIVMASGSSPDSSFAPKHRLKEDSRRLNILFVFWIQNY